MLQSNSIYISLKDIYIYFIFIFYVVLFLLNTIVQMLNNYCMLKTYEINIEIESYIKLWKPTLLATKMVSLVKHLLRSGLPTHPMGLEPQYQTAMPVAINSEYVTVWELIGVLLSRTGCFLVRTTGLAIRLVLSDNQ